MSVDGGTGFDKVVILGTEFPDNFVITENGVFGAGVNVRFQNVEVLEVDGLESDDDFYVLSTPVGVITRVIGGLGSDSVNVGGDVAEPIVMQQLEGSSSTIGHTVTAPGTVYDGLAIDGIDPTVAQAIAGAVVIRETDGSTVVEEGATSDPLSVDSYFVRLATRPADGVTVYVTVSAARSNREEQLADGDSMWLSKTAASAFTRPVTIDGQVVDTPDRALVLEFTSADWDQAQAVYVYGAQDSLPEGERTVTVNHSVLAIIEDASVNSPANDQSASVATFDFAKVRNVEVNIIDDDAPTLIVTPTGGSTLVLEGSLTPDGDGFAPGITDSVNLRLGKVLTAGQTVTVTLSFDAHATRAVRRGHRCWRRQASITFNAATRYRHQHRRQRRRRRHARGLQTLLHQCRGHRYRAARGRYNGQLRRSPSAFTTTTHRRDRPAERRLDAGRQGRSEPRRRPVGDRHLHRAPDPGPDGQCHHRHHHRWPGHHRPAVDLTFTSPTGTYRRRLRWRPTPPSTRPPADRPDHAEGVRAAAAPADQARRAAGSGGRHAGRAGAEAVLPPEERTARCCRSAPSRTSASRSIR